MEEIIHILQEFWFGPQDIYYQQGMAWPLIVGAVITIAGHAISAGKAKKRERGAASRRRKAERDLAHLEATRQEIVDPWKDVEDLSDMISNPFAHLQVATGAAEMQAQQADLSLATTLDTLRATGAGAGGATALAQAALRSKQGVAASIEQPEAENTRLRAQGQVEMDKLRMSEKARLQEARVKGKQFTWGAEEARHLQKLNRAAGLGQVAGQQEMAYGMAGDAAVASAFSTAGSALMSYGLNADLGTNQNNNPYAMLDTSGQTAYDLGNLTNVNTSYLGGNLVGTGEFGTGGPLQGGTGYGPGYGGYGG